MGPRVRKWRQAEMAIYVLLLQHCQASKPIEEGETNLSSVAGIEADQFMNETDLLFYQDKDWQSQGSSATRYVDMETLALNPEVHRPDVLDSIYKIFYYREQCHQTVTISQFSQMSLNAKFHASVYSDLFVHRYDDFNELKESGGPEVDQELCLRQLRVLNERAEIQKREKYSSKDLNLVQLLDTFGHIPSGMYVGDAYWPGHYSECLRQRIDIPGGERGFRYCIASIKHHDWPRDDVLSDFVIVKSAVCLPKACDSLNYKDKYELVRQLQDYNSREVDRDQVSITNLYCLPDEQSSLRQWWRSPPALLTLTLLSLWISLQLYATRKYSQLSRGRRDRLEKVKHQADNIGDDGANVKGFGLTSGFKVEEESCDVYGKEEAKFLVKIYQSLSITNNLRLLFDTSKTSSLMEAAQSLGNKNKNGYEEALIEKPIVDLRVLEGIKVISMCYVIFGHVLMVFTAVIVNGREMADTNPPAFVIANLVPAFSVNAFFTITGLLTSYLMFKQNQSYSLFASPPKWIAFALYRYLRIMPMYALVVLYCKTLGRFAGSGPYWDYGTSAIAQRRNCQQESWLWTLLFASNFKSPVHHCIPAAWYLANDFQFFLVTPVFLAMLHKWPKTGQNLIKLCIAAGFLASFYSIYNSSVYDLRPIANFAPHGFKTYVTHFDYNYTRPQYRIPAYLCGLLIGFILHNFEQQKLKYLELTAKREDKRKTSEAENPGVDSDGEFPSEPGWSEQFERKGMALSFIFVTVCCASPFIGSMLPFNHSAARFMVALITPSYHLLFSLSVGIYIMLATTGFGNKLVNRILSNPMWKPLARLSLCAVLINIEVISYFLLSGHRGRYLDNESLTSLNIISIVGTYLVSIVMCVLFEAPIRAALNHLVVYAMAKLTSKHKAT